MSNTMSSVDQRTQLAGENRMELLIFKLGYNDQLFGINVFKVREVIPCPKLTDVPHVGSHVIGITNVRGETIPVIDMETATGVTGGLRRAALALRSDTVADSSARPLLIVSEYNQKVQAFLVKSVDRIVNRSWTDITPPPTGLPGGHYLTATTQLEDNIVGILDVERVLSELATEMDGNLSQAVSEKSRRWTNDGDELYPVLVIDDSAVARRQLTRVLTDMGLKIETFNDGEQAYLHLEQVVSEGKSISDVYQAIISDIEMPRMDGYTFVSNVKANPAMSGIPVVLHSSLTGGFNKALVEKVGADGFLEKFDPDKLANFVMETVGATRAIG